MLRLAQLPRFAEVARLLEPADSLSSLADLSRPAIAAFGGVAEPSSFETVARRLAPTAAPQAALLNRVASRRREVPGLQVAPGPLTVGFYLYAAGGDFYDRDAQALVTRLQALTTLPDQIALLTDWSVIEARLIRTHLDEMGERFQGPNYDLVCEEFPQVDREGDPNERWLGLLSLEAELRRRSPIRFESRRLTTVAEWESKPVRFYHLANTMRLRKGLPAPRLQELTRVFEGLVEADFLDERTRKRLAFKLAGKLVKVEKRQGERLDDLDTTDFALTAWDDLQAAVRWMGQEDEKAPLWLVDAVAKLGFGQIVAVMHQIQERLSQVPEAGRIVRTIAQVAFDVSDPSVTFARASELIDRWERAYQAAEAGLHEIPEAGDLARTMALAALWASDPEGQIVTFLDRWREAYRAAEEGLREIPEAGKIARMIAHHAYTARNPTRQVGIYLDRWREAYRLAREGLSDVPQAGEIAGTIASVAFKGKRTKSLVALYLRQWKLALDVAKRSLRGNPDADRIAAVVAHNAFPNRKAAYWVGIYVDRWRRAHQAAEEGLRLIPEAGGIAVTVAHAATRAEDPEGQVRIYLERWQRAYRRAVEALRATPVEGNSPQGLADLSFMSADPEAAVLSNIARLRAGSTS